MFVVMGTVGCGPLTNVIAKSLFLMQATWLKLDIRRTEKSLKGKTAVLEFVMIETTYNFH